MKSFIATLMMIMYFSLTTVVAADPTASISPEKSKIAVGESVTVEIVIQDFPTSEGGGVTLCFNPSVVKVTGVSVNSEVWKFANSAGTIDNAEGQVSDIWFSSFSGVSGDATVATIELEAIKPGKSRLLLSESSLNPFASGGDRLSVDLENGAIRVKGKKQGHKRFWKALFR